MTIDRLITLLATVTLVEMMITIGLGATLKDVLGVGQDRGLIGRALFANYILVPAVAVCLLRLFHTGPMVAAGFLVAAVCPGAPYGPPFTTMAKGNGIVAVGLMVILAGSSALGAPVLLGILLPIVAGHTAVTISVAKMVGTLLGVQLLPLCVGMWIRNRLPSLADDVQKPAKTLSLVLNLLLLVVIFSAQFRMLSNIHVKGYIGILCLVVACIAVGWLMTSRENGRAFVITTSLRNVGVSLVIVTASFARTPAITSATAYALFQTLTIALIALAWGRFTPPAMALVKKQAA